MTNRNYLKHPKLPDNYKQKQGNHENSGNFHAKLERGHKRGDKRNILHIQSKLIGIGMLIKMQPLTHETDMYNLMKNLSI